MMLSFILLTIASAVALVEGQCGCSQFSSNPYDDRVFVVSHGHDWGAHEYFDTQGYIRGFSLEIIRAVCEAANINCRTVWAPYQECWASEPGQHATGGRGLLDRWFDGCVGYGATVDRIHVFAFSAPYVKVIPAYFWVKMGETANFDITNLSGKKIGFLQGWAYDEKCLARWEGPDRQNYILPPEGVFYKNTAADLVPFVLDDTIDALLGSYNDFQYYKDLGQIEAIDAEPIICFLAGNGMMTRKDSDFNDYWNKGFNRIVSNGKFKEICDAASQHSAYGYIDCA